MPGDRTGRRTFECEQCHFRWVMAGDGMQARCQKCLAPAFADPFPTAELLRRLDALSARLLEEDGPL